MHIHICMYMHIIHIHISICIYSMSLAAILLIHKCDMTHSQLFWLLSWLIHNRAICTHIALWFISLLFFSISTRTALLFWSKGPNQRDSKLIIVTNVLISTGNQQAKSVYCILGGLACTMTSTNSVSASIPNSSSSRTSRSVRQNTSIAFYAGLRAPWHWLILYLYLYAVTYLHVKHTDDDQLQVYSTLQQHCNTLLQHCNALQHTHIWVSIAFYAGSRAQRLSRIATHCNTLRHTATHTHTWVSMAFYAGSRAPWLSCTATHCKTLWHTATHPHRWLSIAFYAGSRAPWQSLRPRRCLAPSHRSWGMTHLSTSHGTYVNESWHIRQRVMAHTSTSHLAYISGLHSVDSLFSPPFRRPWGMSHIWTSHGTYLNKSPRIHERVTHSRFPIFCSILQVMSHVTRMN